MNGHLDAGLMTGGHNGLQEVLQVFPQFLFSYRLVGFKELFQLSQTLRLPTGHGKAFAFFNNIVRHLHGIFFDQVLLIEQRSGTICHGMIQIGAGPVEDGHKVVSYNLNTELSQITQGGFVIFDIHVASGQADLDVVVNVYALYNIHVKAGAFDLFAGLFNFFYFPNLAGLLVVQCPNKTFYAGNLLDLLSRNGVVAFTIPTKCHLHSCVLLNG